MKLLITLLLVFFASAAYAQSGERYLVLNKPGHIKRIRFVEGDELSFRLKGDKKRYTAEISKIYPDAILFGEVYVPLKNIRSVRYHKDTYLANMVRISSITAVNAGLTIAGIGLASGMVNAASNDGPVYNSLLLGGLWLAGSGTVIKPLYRRNYKLGPNRWLSTIEFAHPPHDAVLIRP